LIEEYRGEGGGGGGGGGGGAKSEQGGERKEGRGWENRRQMGRGVRGGGKGGGGGAGVWGAVCAGAGLERTEVLTK